MFGVWCLVFGVWCLVFGVWCLVFGVWCLVFGVWCLVCGVWCLVFGVWCLVFGAKGELDAIAINDGFENWEEMKTFFTDVFVGKLIFWKNCRWS